MTINEKAEAIKEAWRNQNINVVVNSVAGSGKTTLILDLLSIYEEKTLVLAFNKSIQEEINEKIAQRGLVHAKAMTLHALGLSAIKRAKPNSKIAVGKNYGLVGRLNERYFSGLSYKDTFRVKYSIMDMNDVSRLFLTNDIEEIEYNMEQMGKFVSNYSNIETIWQNLVEIRDSSYNQRVMEIDFIDMLYLPVHKGYRIPVDPTKLMIDEAQDLSFIQHKLIESLISQGDVTKWIAVGDKNQSIYAFSGAYPASFDLFTEKDNTISLPLNKCFRCAPNIVEKANEVYDVMVAHKVDNGVVQTIQEVADIKQDSMVICRNTKPLFKLYFRLLAENKKCHIVGEDILPSLERFAKPYMKLSLQRGLQTMKNDISEAESKARNGDSYAIFLMKENLEIFEEIIKAFNGKKYYPTILSLFDDIKGIFQKEDHSICLCTIHKSKGLEADVVYILDEILIPSKFARNSVQLIQEKNLKYVARTRAKSELYFLNLNL